MDTFTPPHVSAEQIAQAFDKMYAGFDKTRVAVIEQELAKMIPSESSTVSIGSGYTENENYISLSIFVTNPQTNIEPQSVRFDKIIRSMVYRTEVSKLPVMMSCINRMEQKTQNGKYDIESIPASYNAQLGKYYINIGISKE